MSSLPTGLVKGISGSIATLFKPVNQERKRLCDEVNDVWGSPKRQKVDVFSRFCTPEMKEMTQHTVVLMDFPDEIILLIL
ncbi:uncharacterized protein LACBIDRAFT_305159 [Laccaria bicolor S238N-H82]|uniref:Predicted protein n=1 Tax=Laccaria bicolor (strain S238N-H82 / ATCC MYA-4686) TaxID=486041 RepID=B0CTJ9_LACBS|nr:uncharacterized protein LACBIDRAFT_305159 [Laccaria bicolor S238N-H82]EDR14503.1 predicted protein [Laccaria bicolor S238N-H82]|eukprot:XP_001875062.1 predicted protein [Laccaria bicolor S238N-H82]